VLESYNTNKFHFETVGEPVDMKQSMTPEIHAKCVALGQAMAARLLAE